MNVARSFLASAVLIGSLGAINGEMVADGTIEKLPFTAHSYWQSEIPCH
jgi:hypothetical protein